MASSNTERFDQRYEAVDRWPAHELVSGALAIQQEALRAVAAATEALAEAIVVLAARLQRGGRMVYAGAGSSGLIAQMDALEMPGTFGIDLDRVPVILAGGAEALRTLPSGVEDDIGAAEAAVDRLDVNADDGLVAVAASGSTPFTLAALRRARARGAATIGIACVANSPLLSECHHPILIETPPELIAGSTRMGAGTAQKCALNILSTGVATRLGHVYAGLMVNMRPENAKLKHRAIQIVSQAADVGQGTAERALVETNWSVKTAIVMCAAAVDAGAARERLAASGGHIHAALSQGPAAHGPRQGIGS
ncbi:N-acetylmuramic acid 6-phosphate etherase [Lichenifustis flavocetrariae]|uniref:N-acetylmuramic acid 6-phosphate etherase n=1 Tax=Lichenifustis flavocetrariae TaxID=2949735 RepID=A0AA42CPR9_9HYPH|nr:N-acetylmuramic acid 6-phosphate etherase [Lichenifustis flavocetrariae]MCW6510697.1 N-acetylmuramic acid 6-phosphate etherase [Lichenifustis flavocetrariae]